MRVKSEVKNPEKNLLKITPSHTYNGVHNCKIIGTTETSHLQSYLLAGIKVMDEKIGDYVLKIFELLDQDQASSREI